MEHLVCGHKDHQDHHGLQQPVHQIEPNGDKVLLPPSSLRLLRDGRGTLVVLLLCELVSESVEQRYSDVATKKHDEVENYSEGVHRRHVKVVTALSRFHSEVQGIVVKFMLSASTN